MGGGGRQTRGEIAVLHLLALTLAKQCGLSQQHLKNWDITPYSLQAVRDFSEICTLKQLAYCWVDSEFGMY